MAKKTEQTDTQKVSDMVRITTDNLTNFYKQAADHIDKLESTIEQLNAELQVFKDIELKYQDDFK